MTYISDSIFQATAEEANTTLAVVSHTVVVEAIMTAKVVEEAAAAGKSSSR